jgi:hypothetical protein
LIPLSIYLITVSLIDKTTPFIPPILIPSLKPMHLNLSPDHFGYCHRASEMIWQTNHSELRSNSEQIIGYENINNLKGRRKE